MMFRSASDVFSAAWNFLSIGQPVHVLVSSQTRDVLTDNYYYWEGPCDADVLASCSGPRIIFRDLNEANYESFRRFTGNHSRIILFYQPNLVDPLFRTSEVTTPTPRWLNDETTLVDRMVGRVNCFVTPSICSDTLGAYTEPQIEVLSPTHPVMAVRSPKSQLFEPFAIGSVRQDRAVVLKQRMEDYGVDSFECLWRRFGAQILTPSCRTSLQDLYYREYAGLAKPHIQQGERIAQRWNAGVILLCFVLIIVLCAAGWKQIMKCLKYSFDAQWTKSSPSMSKEDRQIQLRKQMHCFYLAVVVLGLTNVIVPALTLVIGGPVAVFALLWIWYSEFKCTTRCCNHTFWRQEQPIAVNKEMHTSLLPDADEP